MTIAHTGIIGLDCQYVLSPGRLPAALRDDDDFVCRVLKKQFFVARFRPVLKSIRPRWKAYSSGGMVIDAWFIVPNVPISPLEKDFDELKLHELGDAAIRHAKSHKLACDIYVVLFKGTDVVDVPEASFRPSTLAHRCRRGASAPSAPSTEDASVFDDDMLFDVADESEFRGSSSLSGRSIYWSGSIRALNNSMPARPNMARLRVFKRLLAFGLATAPWFGDGVPDGVDVAGQYSRELL